MVFLLFHRWVFERLRRFSFVDPNVELFDFAEGTIIFFLIDERPFPLAYLPHEQARRIRSRLRASVFGSTVESKAIARRFTYRPELNSLLAESLNSLARFEVSWMNPRNPRR